MTAFGRGGENKSGAAKYIQKDIMELTKEDIAGFDAVVDGFGAWKDEEQPMHVKTSQHLCDLLSGTDIRLLVVGGAGSLYVNTEHTAQVKDGADFPAMFLPLANAQGQELEELRKRSDVNWTFISPAGDFQADGERSGKYFLAGEELTLNAKGESVISTVDQTYVTIMVENAFGGMRSYGDKLTFAISPEHMQSVINATDLSPVSFDSRPQLPQPLPSPLCL